MDDGMQYTTVGHRGMVICNPIGSDQLDEVIELIAPSPGRSGRAIDIGCGKGEFLIRLAERSGCAGLGIDPNGVFATPVLQRVCKAGRTIHLQIAEDLNNGLDQVGLTRAVAADQHSRWLFFIEVDLE